MYNSNKIFLSKGGMERILSDVEEYLLKNNYLN